MTVTCPTLRLQYRFYFQTVPTIEDLLLGDVGHRKIPDLLGSTPSRPQSLLHKKGQVRRGARSVGETCLTACCALELGRAVN